MSSLPPPAVQEALALRKRYDVPTWGVFALSVGLIIGAAVLATQVPEAHELAVLWGGMLGGCVPGWVALFVRGTKQEYKDACRLIREYTRQKDQQTVKAAILGVSQPAEPAHPIHALAQRVRVLAASEPRIPQLVDQLCARFDQLQAELGSLQQAIAAEKTLGSEQNPRLDRLAQVVQHKTTEQQALTDAIRDLHVELTVREGSDHDPICGQIDDLLASLAAEAEVAQATGQAAAAARAGRQEPAAQTTRDKARRQQQKLKS